MTHLNVALNVSFAWMEREKKKFLFKNAHITSFLFFHEKKNRYL